MPPSFSSARRLALSRTPSICVQCVHRLLTRNSVRQRRLISGSSRRHDAAVLDLKNRYFFANHRPSLSPALEHSQSPEGAIAREEERGHERARDLSVEGEAQRLSSPRPRRRGRFKRSADSNAVPGPLPLDASSTLSALATSAPPLSLKRRALAYLALSKPRLATLIVLTTTASYSLYPVPSLLSVSATQTPSLSTLTLAFLTTGTFATVASANALNMLFEPEHDAKMSRTRNRPLVRGLLSKRAALIFAIFTGLAGTGILWVGVNPTTSLLGASNIVLYAFAYTSMKRLSVVNTWVGAVVGAIPPLMGWAAAGGHYLTTPVTLSDQPLATLHNLKDEAKALLFSPEATGGWLLAALLFAWQFPHFNALSHPIRHEYANAGYRMMVSFYPRLNARVALRYSAAMFPICFGLTHVGVTDRGFLITSSAVNGWMLREAWRFWRTGGGEGAQAAKTARGLFWASVWHLPLVLVFAMAQKNGLWSGVWRGLVGDPDGDEDEDEWEEEEEELGAAVG